MSIDLGRTAIDLEDPANAELLSDLQGNILKGHGRQLSAHLFVRFVSGNPKELKRWIAGFAGSRVTSAKAQGEAAKTYRATGAASGLFASLLLSAEGYLALGFEADQIPRDEQAVFNAGMKARRGVLSDPPSSQWQPEFAEAMHAVILLASDLPSEVDGAVSQIRGELQDLAEAVWVERGSRWHNEAGLDIEPFGFVDGISQPIFTKQDVERAGQAEPWNPSAPLQLVLARDPLGQSTASYGSFLVYRKLEQDVVGWRRRVGALAEQLGVDPPLAGALAVGRFQDGTPVLLHDAPAGTQDNRFDYSSDPEGAKCPFHSHLRKTNPRGDTQNLLSPGVPFEEEREHRIVRRGIPFGKPDDVGHSPVGLLFLAYQSDIARQFEFMQSAWANKIHFIKQKTGLDPVIGQTSADVEGQQWPQRWGQPDAGTVSAEFSSFVKLVGGEYFFAPSLSFFSNLLQPPGSQS